MRLAPVLRQIWCKKEIFEKITIDNQQVTDCGRVLLNPASATTTSEKQITKAFRTFFVYTPVQGSDSKAQIYRVSHNIATVLLSVIPKHPETKRRYPYCLFRAVESAVGHTDSADVDGLMAAVAGKPMMGSLEQV